jgi:Family of unknown function (DUF5996)
VTLYPTACGLTTGRIPYGDEALEIDFDFIAHELNIRTSRGDHGVIQLVPMSVSEFYGSVMGALTAFQMPVSIYRKPAEVESRLPFDEDDVHRSYDAEYATRCWRIVCSSANVFDRFRSRYYGKASPVHFFWGSFDLAVTRFSGRVAPPHPGGVPNLPDWVTRDAYSHEVSSAGFWPGGARAPYPLFYSYAYPEPRGFAGAKVRPLSARYESTLHEFILPYDDVRRANEPERTLLAFLQSTYAAAADLGAWDRTALEVPPELLPAVGMG